MASTWVAAVADQAQSTASRALVAGESEANQRKLFFDNAVRIYGVPD